MKKAWIKITIYEPQELSKFSYQRTKIEGDCEICNQFPCVHTEKYWNFEKQQKEEGR